MYEGHSQTEGTYAHYDSWFGSRLSWVHHGIFPGIWDCVGAGGSVGLSKAICRLGLHWDQQENRKCEQRITHGMGALKDRDKASISDWQAWSLGGPAEAGSCPNMSFRHPVLPPFLM